MSSRERQLQEWRDLKRQASAKVPLGTSNSNTSSLLTRTTKAGIKGPAQTSLLPKPRCQGSEDVPQHQEAQPAAEAPPDSAPHAAQTSTKPSLAIPNFMSATLSSKQHAGPGDTAPTSGASSGRRSRPDSARKPAVSASQLQHMESQFTQLAGRLDSLKRESMRASISGSSKITDDSRVEQVLAPLQAGQAQPARGSRPCPPLTQQPVQQILAARLEALKRDSMQVCRDAQRVPVCMSHAHIVSQTPRCQLQLDRAVAFLGHSTVPHLDAARLCPAVLQHAAGPLQGTSVHCLTLLRHLSSGSHCRWGSTADVPSMAPLTLSPQGSLRRVAWPIMHRSCLGMQPSRSCATGA